MKDKELHTFLTESRKIEGLDPPSLFEMQAAQGFLALREVAVSDIANYVNVTEPGARLRNQVGLDVQVGSYYPPRGGPEIVASLMNLLLDMERMNPFSLYIRYERLHPFTDGNGRSGRLLWLWSMFNQDRTIYQSSFLHTFHYQTLVENEREGIDA